MIERTCAGLAAAAANGRRVGVPARSMMPTRPRPTTSGTKALLPSTLRRCLVVPAPRCIGTWKQRHSPDRVATNLATLPLLCRGGPHPYGFESCRTRQLSARCSPLPHNSGFFPLLSCVSTGQRAPSDTFTGWRHTQLQVRRHRWLMIRLVESGQARSGVATFG